MKYYIYTYWLFLFDDERLISLILSFCSNINKNIDKKSNLSAKHLDEMLLFYCWTCYTWQSLDKPKTVRNSCLIDWLIDLGMKSAWISSDVAVVESKVWKLRQLLAARWRRGYNRWLTARRLWVWGLGLWRATVAFFCYSGLQKALIWIRSTQTDLFSANKWVLGTKRSKTMPSSMVCHSTSG